MASYDTGGYSIGSGYVDPSDMGNKSLKQMQDEFYFSNYVSNSTVWMQGSIDKKFKVGDQNMQGSIFGSGYNNQNQKFFFNLIRRHINMICGFQRKNRKSTVILPNSDGDDPVADDYNKVMRWCDDRDGFQEYLSQAFEGSCDTGMTLLHMYPDYTFDPISGDLFTDCVSYNNFLIDSYYRKQDLSDCNGIWRRRWVSKQIAKTMLPGYAGEIDKMHPAKMKDGKFPLQAELMNVPLNNLFTYDEFYYRSTREAKIVLDPKSGEATEWQDDETEESDMMEQVLAQQPWLIVKKTQVPTIKLVISLGDKVVYHGANLLNIDDYPFVPSLCYHEPDVLLPAWRTMGVIRNLRDSQFLYNMRKVIELQILQSQVNAGWIFPIDAVTDIKAFRQSSGGDAFLIPLKAGRLPSEIQRIEPSAIPQSLLELSASLSEDITKISGVNEELLGSATDDKSGILSMLRQGAGLTTLQTIFDKCDYTQRLYGKIRLQAIRKNFSKGKIRNILGHDADERFFTSHAQKYGLTVEEGNYSATQRQFELQQLLHFKELGIPISNKSIIRAAFITNKKLVLQEMEEENQAQQQAQQAQQQKQEQLDKSKMMESFARSRSLLATEKEKMAKVDEIHAGAEHQRATADLEAVRTMIELEDMDLQNFKSNLELAQYIKALNVSGSMAAQEAQEMKDASQASQQPQAKMA
ncbi:unnamed protein product [Sphagnum jensenii]|uniref:Portal protein n=1 Tax=Sphagnum jensenii TaxID=128206 RepID=A0ABP0VB06_9BRYO